MKTKDLKSLASTIASVVQETNTTDERAKLLQEGFLNSLTEKARQVASKEMEDEEEEDEEEEGEEEMEDEDEEEIPSSKKKSKMVKEDVELAEKAAPGYEDWASDPKVKASFKKQYGKRWREVLYAKSWNMKKVNEEWKSLKKTKADLNAIRKSGMKVSVQHGEGDTLYRVSKPKKKVNEEIELAEGVRAKRMRIIRKAIKSDNDLKPEVADFMKRSFQKQRYRDEKLSGGKGAVKALEVRMKRRSDARKAKHGYSSSGYQGLPESEQLNEKWKSLKKTKADLNAIRKKGYKVSVQHGEGDTLYRVSKPKRRVNESEQLDEAGYKRLMRLKKAAYTAQDKAYRSFTADQNKPAKLARAAAEREAQVAAGMARRGGASQEAVKGGGSRIGKSGKYTKKAGRLANMRDKALARFRMKARTAELFDKGEDQSRKRERQQAQAAFEKKARTGDFGQDNQAALRARSNFQKKYGRLRGK